MNEAIPRLHIALRQRNNQIATRLVLAGADINLPNDQDITPSKLAEDRGLSGLIELANAVKALLAKGAAEALAKAAGERTGKGSPAQDIIRNPYLFEEIFRYAHPK